MKLFLPWEGSEMEKPNKDRKVFLPKRRVPLEDSCFKTIGGPFFSLPNPSGTVRSFLNALEKDHQDEAMGYLSTSAATMVDFEGIKNFFGERKLLRFFSDDIFNEIRTVALTCKNDEGNTEVIFVQMVAEPNRFGKWKINYIEKE
ncbi:hypothetical protein CLNEO_03860 [Anaerotignum neopropionicum]|uniref:Uncharacterized protein n=1 Tax=Anaerotignum neopropionicum TaxID=36847 RepID=A0A136WIJ9_9FIRM|nr:hypothetical protein [Anaerotignum neopropionicum]KXL54159.1 hypothetical protein CLNEO_02570 [Anaerotignum neopropionicum]KXL54284.1 hypothetical protein CLNEO_03860 [Anaerotignum neopropionicum]